MISANTVMRHCEDANEEPDMTTTNKEDYHAYLQSPAFGVMSFQQWLAAQRFMQGLFSVEESIQFNRELKGLQ